MATYTVAAGGGNINAASTYVGGVGIPGAADWIDFTATSGQLTVNVATTIQDINFSSYTNVITFNNTLNVSRNITFNTTTSTYTTAGANGITKTGTGAIVSNGKTWTAGFTFGIGTYTVTFNDKMTVSGAVSFNSTGTVTLSPNNVLDPERFDVTGDFQMNSTGLLLGTALIKFTGTATQTISWTNSSQLRTNVKVDKTGGALNFSGTMSYNTGTFTYVQGTTNTGTSTLFVSTATTIFNTNGSSAAGATTTSSTGINWYNLNLTTTLNITSNFTVINTLTANAGTITRSASEDVYLGGSLSMVSTLTSTSATIIMNGTGSWSGAGAVIAPLTINTTGTITISGSVTFSTRTLTYTTAASVVTTGSTLNIIASCTLATNGITWINVSIPSGTVVLTLTNNFNCTGTLLVNGGSGNASSLTLTFTGVGVFNPTGAFEITTSPSGVGTVTITLPNNISVTSLTYANQPGASNRRTVALNGATNISVSGNITIGGGNGATFGGTCTLVAAGSGTFSVGNSAGAIYGGPVTIPINIAATGTYTFANFPYFSNTTITYTSGTVTGVLCQFTTCTLNLNAGGQWGTTVGLVGATTLTSNATFTYLQTYTTAVVFSGAFTVNVKGDLYIGITTSGASTPIIINGTGAQTWSHGSAVYLSNNLTIDKTSGTLTVSGSVYYVTGTLTYTASGGSVTTTGSTIVFNGTTTIATNGITWNNVQLGGASPTYTLSNNFTVGGTLTLNASGTETVNGSILYLASLSHTGALCQGTTTFTFYTTGTWSTTGANALRNPTIIDTSSNTLTIASQIRYDTGTLTYTSGTVDTTTNLSTIVFSANTTLTTNGITWYNATVNVASILTLTNNFVWNNNFSITTAVAVSFAGAGNIAPTIIANLVLSAASTLTVKNNIQINNATLFGTINTNTISISGNLIVNGATSGTTALTLNGTGAQSWTHGSAVYLSNNLTINKASGTLTIGTNVYYNTNTLTYTAGVVTTVGSTLNINASTTLVTNGIIWNAITWSGGTLTLTNALTATGLITVSHQTPVLNGSDLYANGGMTFTGINLSTNFAYISGTSTIRFEGTGSWTSTQRGNYQTNIIINPTSNSFTINDVYYVAGTITYNNSNGGRVTSAVLTLGYYTALASRGLSRSVTFNTNEMRWDYILCMSYTDTGVTTSTITCLSNLNVNYFGFVGIGSAASDTWNFSLSTGANLVNVGNFNIDARATVNLVKDFTTRTLSFSTGIFGRLNNNTVTVTDLLTSSAGSGAVTWTGTTKLILGDNCKWTRTDNLGPVLFTMEFQGNLTLGSTAFPLMTYSASTLTYTGRKNAKVLGRLAIGTATMTNMHKVTFQSLTITSGATVTMNQFFGGSPDLKSTIIPSSTTNYTISFSDSLEKIARHVNVSRATILRPGQLAIITDKCNIGNNVGIKFAPNQVNNGISRNLPANDIQLGYGEKGLIKDPALG